MKKRLYPILIFCLVLLAACSRPTTSSKASKTSTSSSKVASLKKTDQSVPPSTQETPATSSTRESSSSTNATTSPKKASQPNSTPVDKNPSGADYFSVQGAYGEVIIVNKKHPLAPTYAPGENPTAKAAFVQLLADMQAQGYAISQNYSGFRSYDTQAMLYQNYVARDGQANADRYSARPGYSEHQTGLAFDVLDASGQLLEEPSAAYWLSTNAHRYGFVVRYQPGKEAITGYMAESWHLRYIGQEAKAIYQSGLTLEEYYGVPGGGYD